MRLSHWQNFCQLHASCYYLHVFADRQVSAMSLGGEFLLCLYIQPEYYIPFLSESLIQVPRQLGYWGSSGPFLF